MNKFYGNVKTRILSAIRTAISAIVTEKYEFSCSALIFSLENELTCESDYEMYNKILDIYRDNLFAREGVGGFSDCKFWNWYWESKKKKVRIERLTKLYFAVEKSNSLTDVVENLKNY
jgi:hypothetical protein